MTPTPIVLVIGFLGAGKTTFIRELLPFLESSKINSAVVINDYQNARIDAATLREASDQVFPIAGSCICCDALQDLSDTLLNVSVTFPQVVVVETNGTTDPYPLIEFLATHPELRKRFWPILVVTVIDPERWQKRHWHNDLERLQVEPASHLYLTRADACPAEKLGECRRELLFCNGRAAFTSPQQLAGDLDQVLQVAPERPAYFGLRGKKASHALAHGFSAIQMDLPVPVQAGLLTAWLKSLPGSVLRAKGLVELAETPKLYATFQYLGDGQSPTFMPRLSDSGMMPTLILIGVQLPKEQLEHDMRKNLYP